MQPLKYIAAVVVLAVWLSWDFTAVCFRTFVLGQGYQQQMHDIEEDEL